MDIPLTIKKSCCCCIDCLYLQIPTIVRPGKCLVNSDCFSKKCADCCYPLVCSDKIDINRLQNKEILNKIKQEIEKLTAKHTYHFSGETELTVSDMYPLKYINRYPTTKETNNYLISRIRWNMLGRDITTQQYRSLKGEIMRGNTTGPVHFIRKFVSGQACLEETMHFMVTKKYLGVGEIPVTFPTTLKTSTIDIEVSKEECSND